MSEETGTTAQTRLLIYVGRGYDLRNLKLTGYHYILLRSEAQNDGQPAEFWRDTAYPYPVLSYDANLDNVSITRIGGLLQVDIDPNYSVRGPGRVPKGVWANELDRQVWWTQESAREGELQAGKNAANGQIDAMYLALEQIRKVYNESSRAGKIAIMAKVVDYITRPTRLASAERDKTAEERGKKKGYEQGVKDEQRRQKAAAKKAKAEKSDQA